MGTVDIGKAISDGWNLFKENMGVCILATIVAALICGVSFGICAGPMICGLFMVLRRLLKKSEPKPGVGDVFKGFDKFLPAFLLILVCGICYCVLQCILMIIPVIGWILLVAIAFVYGPILNWSLMLVANRGMTWTGAVGLVLKETFGGRFNMPILLGIVAGIIGSAGVVACGIGLLFTIPLAYCIHAAAYEQMFPDTPVAEAPQAEA